MPIGRLLGGRNGKGRVRAEAPFRPLKRNSLYSNSRLFPHAERACAWNSHLKFCTLRPCRCGVFAYVNHGVVRPQQYIVDALVTGLRRLEYRGYDSAGIAIDDLTHGPEVSGNGNGGNGNGHPATPPSIVIKETGKIDNLAKLVEARTHELGFNMQVKVSNHAGIAHTRWVSWLMVGIVQARSVASMPACAVGPVSLDQGARPKHAFPSSLRRRRTARPLPTTAIRTRAMRRTSSSSSTTGLSPTSPRCARF